MEGEKGDIIHIENALNGIKGDFEKYLRRERTVM